MPQNMSGEYVCINHEEQYLEKASGKDGWFHALTMVRKRDNNRMQFKPDKGAAVMAFVCPLCGYLELYALTAAVMRAESGE